jgi:hypothetical protein
MQANRYCMVALSYPNFLFSAAVGAFREVGHARRSTQNNRVHLRVPEGNAALNGRTEGRSLQGSAQEVPYAGNCPVVARSECAQGAEFSQVPTKCVITQAKAEKGRKPLCVRVAPVVYSVGAV